MYYRITLLGITGIEVLLGHVVCQLLIMVFQSLMVIAFALLIFDITNEGDVFWICLLTMLTGLCGMCFGKKLFIIIHFNITMKSKRIV